MADDGQYQDQDTVMGGLLSRLLNPPPDPDRQVAQNVAPPSPAQAPRSPVPTIPANDPRFAVPAGEPPNPVLKVRPQAAPPPAVAPKPATPPAVTPSGNGPAAPKSWADYVRQSNDSSLQSLSQAQQSATDLQNEPSATAENAPLEAQRTALAQPLNPNDPNYRPGIATRIARGFYGARKGGPGGILDPSAVGATPYGAPNSRFTADTARRQAQAGVLESEEQRNIANEAADTNRGKANAAEERANAAGFNDVAKAATDAEKVGGTMLTNLGKAGLKPQYDQQGNLVGVEDDPDSPFAKARQASTELKTAQAADTEAQEELRRSQNDPNSPAYKLAVAKAQTARGNMQAAQERARAYSLNAFGANEGTTPEGTPLPGATETAGGTPMGSRFQGQYTKAQQNTARFNDVVGATDQLESSAKSLVGKKGKGSLSDPIIATAMAEPTGTFGQWMQGQVANGNLTAEQRDYVTNLRAFRENLQALRQSVGGSVSDSQVDRLMQMAPGAQTPDLDYLMRQTGQIRNTTQRLSEGVPQTEGGNKLRGGNKPSANAGAPPQSVVDSAKEGQYLHGPNGEIYQKKGGKAVEVKKQ